MRRFFRVTVVLAIFANIPLGAENWLDAQEISPEIAELRARLDGLEQTNRELEAAFQRLQQTRAATFESGEYSAEAELRETADACFSEASNQNLLTATLPKNDLTMSSSWHNGLEAETADKRFRVHVGGRTQFDAAWFSVPSNLKGPVAGTGLNNPYGDGVDFRRARLRIDGTMYDVIDWAAEYDFVNAARVGNAANNGLVDHTVIAFTDLWWTFKYVPLLGNVRVGNQKEAIGLEHLVSSRFLPFMERSFNQDSFYGGFFNGFTPGISAFDTMLDERGTWNVGLFKTTDNVFSTNTNDGDYSVVARTTVLPVYENEGAQLLHFGVSLREASTAGDRTRFRTRSPVRSGIASQWPTPADTGLFSGDDMLWLNMEAVMVNDSLTVQAEYLNSYVHNAAPVVGGVSGPPVGTLHYQGGYVQFLYYLTGEHDNYNRKTGAFDRVTPFRNYSPICTANGTAAGPGAWQVGARYNYLNLNDRGVNGGILHDMTAGVNWFLNPNMKVQFNYSATHRDSALALGDGWIHGWGIRFAHDF